MFLKRKVFVFCSLLCVLLTAFFSANRAIPLPASAKVSNRPQIILDAGHGGFDGGAVASDGTVEKELNLNICIALSKMLSSAGYEVIMTRTEDTSTEDNSQQKIPSRKKSDLKNRLALMKKYPEAVFVSVHLNKFTTSAASGSQVFYSGKVDKSKQLGEEIQKKIVSLLQPENTRVNKQATSGTYLLYNATIPAVLVECGFLSNYNDLKMLKTEEYQQKMAFCIYCGITEFFSNNIKET